MLKGIHALVLGGLCIFKNNIIEYIYAEGDSCPGARRIMYF